MPGRLRSAVRFPPQPYLSNQRLTLCRSKNVANQATADAKFINPHRLFHGGWIPQWFKGRPEVSEKAKKVYAYLTYFAGGKGSSWQSFGLLAEKLHCSRRHVMRLVQELSTHRLIAVTKTLAIPSAAIVRIIIAFSGILGCRAYCRPRSRGACFELAETWREPQKVDVT
jgi:hypothetical protein